MDTGTPQPSTGQRAVSCFNNGFNCSQAVLSAFGPAMGLDHETALRAAAAFGAGLGRRGETCGAVTGAMMVIGLKYGKVKPEDNEAKEKTFRLVHELMGRFSDRNGSTLCRELIGCDLSTVEGLQLAKDKKVFDEVCPRFIQHAVDILEKIL